MVCEGESVTGVIEESDRSMDCIAGACCLINICRNDCASSRRVTICALRIAFSCSSIVALRAICVSIKAIIIKTLFLYKQKLHRSKILNLLREFIAFAIVNLKHITLYHIETWKKIVLFCSYVILPDFAGISRLLRCLIIPFTSLEIFFIFLIVRDRFLFASRSSVESVYAVCSDDVTVHGTCFVIGDEITCF